MTGTLIQRLRDKNLFIEQLDEFALEAADALEQQAAEIAEQSRELNDAINEFTSANSKIEQQAAEIAALRADAERLLAGMQEALKCIPAVSSDGNFYVEHNGPDGEYIGTEQINPVNVVQSMAAAIDAALRQEQQAKGEGA